MTTLIDQLVQRMLLEGTWRLLVDADEPAPFPEEDDYYERLELEDDDEKYDELLIEMLGKQAQIGNAQPLVGGPLPNHKELASTAVVEMDLTHVDPNLRPLKQYAKRVLVKRVLNRFFITLLVDQRPPQGLDRDTLTRIGRQLIDEIDQFQKDMEEAELQELSGKALKKAKKQAKKTPKLKTYVQFDVVVVGDAIGDNNLSGSDYRASLKALQQWRFKKQVIIQGYLLDSRSNQAWSTNTLTGWRQRRYWRYALRHRQQTIADIRQQLDNDKPKYLGAIATGIGAVVTAYAIKLLILAFTGLPSELMFLLDFIIPTIAAMSFCYWQRLNHFASIHMKWFLITYIGLFGLSFLAMAWPPSFNHFTYVLSVGLVTYFINIYAALMLEME